MEEITGLSLLEKLEKELQERYSDDTEWAKGDSWEKSPLVGLCYRNNDDGCVNQDSPIWRDEDLYQAIIDKFYLYFLILRDLLEKEYPRPKDSTGWLKIVIEPCHEDTSFIVIFDTEAYHVILNQSHKAWNFVWDSPEEMAASMLEDYNSMKGEIIKIKERANGK
jgi:hypothetical protein